MKVLVSSKFKAKLERPETLIRFSFENMIAKVERLSPADLARGDRIQLVRGVREEIYVMRVDNFRVFFTRQDDNLVLLDAELV